MKPNVWCFCEPHKCPNIRHPFKVNSQDLVNRKQDNYEWKPLLFWHHGGKQCHVFLQSSAKNWKEKNIEFFKAKILQKNSFIQWICWICPLPYNSAKCGIDIQQLKCSNKRKFFKRSCVKTRSTEICQVLYSYEKLLSKSILWLILEFLIKLMHTKNSSKKYLKSV